MATQKRTKGSTRATFEIEVLNDDMKKRIVQCIERRGKITVSMVLKGAKALGNGDGGFEQKVD